MHDWQDSHRRFVELEQAATECNATAIQKFLAQCLLAVQEAAGDGLFNLNELGGATPQEMMQIAMRR